MTPTPRIPGDEARVTVTVAAPPDLAFRLFTEEVNLWWRTGVRYRALSKHGSVVHIEGKVGGKMFETAETARGPRVVETGHVLVWEPPRRLVLAWRAVNFAPDEKTEVEVLFEPTATGTQVTVKHRGWSTIRPDHPVRHGADVPAFIRTMGLWWGDLMTSLREHIAKEGANQAG